MAAFPACGGGRGLRSSRVQLVLGRPGPHTIAVHPDLQSVWRPGLPRQGQAVAKGGPHRQRGGAAGAAAAGRTAARGSSSSGRSAAGVGRAVARWRWRRQAAHGEAAAVTQPAAAFLLRAPSMCCMLWMNRKCTCRLTCLAASCTALAGWLACLPIPLAACPLQEAVSSSSPPPAAARLSSGGGSGGSSGIAGGGSSRRTTSSSQDEAGAAGGGAGAAAAGGSPHVEATIRPQREGVQVAALRSMSDTRIAKFKRLLDEQVRQDRGCWRAACGGGGGWTCEDDS